MLYTILLAVTIFFALAFLIVWFRTFDKTRLKNLWVYCRDQAKANLKFKANIKEAEDRGEKPYLFDKGLTVIYAKDKKEANLKYQKLLLKEKSTTQKRKPKPRRKKDAGILQRKK